MKKHLTILLLFVSLVVKSATYYVDVAGSDGADGSLGTPWQTLSHATTQVTTVGDIIHLNTGNHSATTTSDLAVGVSIEGEGVLNTTITSTISDSYAATISLASGVVNTDGNQHISGIAFNGSSEVAWGAIYIQARGNVHIYDCSFDDFAFTAVLFNGKVSDFDESEPSIWSENCSFYNNTVTNCCEEQPGEWMSGALHIGALDGMEIYNNTFTETARGAGNCGYPIKNRNLKIHDNTIYKLPSTSAWNDWNFAIELWNYRGNVEIYNNHIEGSIDIDHVQKAGLTFGLKVYNNYFGYSTLPPSSGDWTNLSAGLYIEFACEDIYIYNNEFHNLESPIRFSPRDEYVNGVHIYYNLMHQIGNTNGDAGCNLMNFAGNDYTINDLNFINNTIYAGENGAQYGIILPDGTGIETFTDVDISNNVYYGFIVNPIDVSADVVDQLSIENNVFNNNGSNAASINMTPTNYVNQNNITDNPLFVSLGTDFSLQESSTLRNAGIAKGIISNDMNGNSIEGLPDIGAYEYQTVEESEVQSIQSRKTKSCINGGKVRLRNGKTLIQ
jgi:hypothetical protein